MPEFTYQGVTAEMTRLGFTYPKNEDFTEGEIEAAIEDLPDYNLTTTMATLKNKKVTPETLTAFAKLASTLGSSVSTAYDGLEIVRDTTATERRESALSDLKVRENQRLRDAAVRSLQATEKYGTV